ncbi:MAG: hypothetical protein CML23_00395 [Rhizobiaceae bacterium]|nr:hypothetical protein [Rhizobiaceae bacterium]
MLKTISTAALAGLITSGAAFAGMLDVHNPKMRFESVAPSLTELDAYFVRNGKPVTVDLVRQVEIGVGRDKVAALLGEPIKVTRRGNKATWDYNLKFVTADDGELVCQYKVLFGNAQQVDETVWRRPQCRELMVSRN